MAFEGVPVGPFAGKDAIAQAYHEQPPDDELDVLDVRAGRRIHSSRATAWRREPDVRAGELRLTVEDASHLSPRRHVRQTRDEVPQCSTMPA
jgi:hypothetical protein